MEQVEAIGDSSTMNLRGCQFTLDMTQRDLWEFCKERNVLWGDARERIRQIVGILSFIADKMDDDLRAIERLDEEERRTPEKEHRVDGAIGAKNTENKNLAKIMLGLDPEGKAAEYCHDLIDEEWPDEKIEGEDPDDIRTAGRGAGIHVGFAVGLVFGNCLATGDLREKLLRHDKKTTAAYDKLMAKILAKGFIGR